MLDEGELLLRLTRLLPGSEFHGLRPLPGGVSSLTFAVTRRRADAEERIVVKVSPPGLPPVKNRDVLRQARVLSLLGDSAVPVPAVLVEDPGAPPLFVMGFERGQSYEPLLDVVGTGAAAGEPPSPEVVTARALTAARTLADLQRVRAADESETAVGAELERWKLLLDTVPDDIVPGHAGLYRRLVESLPSPVGPVLVHGDFRLANMLFDEHRLRAVIDWEIWSVGDPRTDLAWLLMHTDPAHRFHEVRPARDVRAGAGMPSSDRLLEEYLAAGCAPPVELNWFLAYCHYKTAATLAVFVKRNRRRHDPDHLLVTAATSLAAVIERGHAMLDQSK